MGEDELISDERREQEDLNSDEEVRTSKERVLTAAKNDTCEILRTFRMTLQSTLEPVAESSKGLQLARKTIASTRSKKLLQGFYEAIPEGAALVKTSSLTLTIKYPGQDDTGLHKSEVARFGTPAQPRIPLIQFAARKPVINHNEKLQRTMNVHQVRTNDKNKRRTHQSKKSARITHQPQLGQKWCAKKIHRAIHILTRRKGRR